MKIVKKFEYFQDSPDLDLEDTDTQERELAQRDLDEEMSDYEDDIMEQEDDIIEDPVEDVEGYEEEEDDYIGIKLMKELAHELGEEIINNTITHNGQEIKFYSETEKFHIGRKKFETVEEVLEHFTTEEPTNVDIPEHEEILEESFLMKKFTDFK